jgi:hypothetical protein
MEPTKYYVIVKWVIKKNGVKLPIVLVDDLSEIMEFDDYDKALEIAMMFERNSDSGWKYTVKPI